MVRIAARTGLDFARGVKSNTRSGLDTPVVLASRNELINPSLSDFLPDGTLEGGWELAAAPARRGWAPYVGPKGGKITKQITSPKQASDPAYLQNQALIDGAPLPDLNANPALPRPARPAVKVVTEAETGYPAGDYLLSFCWVLGSLDERYAILTAPAPGARFTLQNGQRFQAQFTKEIPAKVIGVAWVLTEPAAAGQNPDPSTYWVQRIVDVRNMAPGSPYVFDGHFKRGRRAPTANQTYIGRYETLAAPRLYFGSGWATTLPMDTQVSFRIRSRWGGWSAVQRQTHAQIYQTHRGTFVYVELPKLPSGTAAAQILIQAPDGQWHAIDYGLVGGAEIPLSFKPYFTTDDPQKVNTGTSYQRTELTKTDETGIPSPDQAVETPVVYGSPKLAVGWYEVRATDDYVDPDTGLVVESAPSAPAYAQITTVGQAIRVMRPASTGNLLENPELSDLDPTQGLRPRDWTVTQPSGVRVLNFRNRYELYDTSGAATDADVAVGDAIDVDPTTPHVAVADWAASRRTSGMVQVLVRFLSAAGATLTTVAIGSTAAPAGSTGSFERAFGPAGVAGAPADYVAWPTGTAKIRYAVRLIGSSANGARNLDATLRNMAVFRGLVSPNKRPVGSDPVPDVEDAEDAYPNGGHMVVVENPVWTAGKGNGLEYYGPWGVANTTRYFARGLKIPIEPDRGYSLSADFSVAGVSGPISLFKTVVKDGSGKVVLANPYLVDGVQGTTSGRPAVFFTTPSDAAYLEFTTSTVGEGLIRAWAFQLEKGAASAWTNDRATGGTIEVSFDTRAPGTDETHPLTTLLGVRSWLRAGAITEEPPGTAVILKYRSRETRSDPWSAYYPDLASLPKARFVGMRAELSTTNVDLTPELHELSLEVARGVGVLLRADGSEYPGGIVVQSWPAVVPEPEIEVTQTEAGTRRVRETSGIYDPYSGDLARWAREFVLVAYTDEGAALVNADILYNAGEFVVEAWGMRHKVRVEKPFRWPANVANSSASSGGAGGASRVMRTPRPDHPSGYWFVHVSEKNDARVLSSESLS